jgi:hypothetical protein
VVHKQQVMGMPVDAHDVKEFGARLAGVVDIVYQCDRPARGINLARVGRHFPGRCWKA